MCILSPGMARVTDPAAAEASIRGQFSRLRALELSSRPSTRGPTLDGNVLDFEIAIEEGAHPHPRRHRPLRPPGPRRPFAFSRLLPGFQPPLPRGPTLYLCQLRDRALQASDLSH